MKKYIWTVCICVSLLLTGGCASDYQEGAPAEHADPTEAAPVQETAISEAETQETAPQEGISEAAASGEVPAQEDPEEFDIAAELAAVEEQAELLREALQNDSSQAALNVTAEELYQLWDQELNDLWNRLQASMRAEEMSALTAEELQWIAFKEAEVAAAGQEYEGGSIYASIVYGKAAELTRERVYELADYFAESEGQTGPVSEDAYAGFYADRQGTEDSYSELELNALGDGVYKASISLYRLTTLEGTAVLQGEILLFEDPTMQVKGEIAIEGTGAVLTITESSFPYLCPGDIFEFPEKY